MDIEAEQVNTEAGLDSAITRIIKEKGFAVINLMMPVVGTLEIPVYYTVGLTEKGWPEMFIAAGVSQALAANLIMSAIWHWEKNSGPIYGVSTDPYVVAGNKEIRVKVIESVVDYHPFFGEVKRRYLGKPVSVVQVLIQDEKGAFPLDSDYDDRFLQLPFPVGKQDLN